MNNAIIAELMARLIPLVNPNIAYYDLMRLVNGDLAHIGDAILAGKGVYHVSDMLSKTKDLTFSDLPCNYIIRKDWWEDLPLHRYVLLIDTRSNEPDLASGWDIKEGLVNIASYRPATAEEALKYVL